MSIKLKSLLLENDTEKSLNDINRLSSQIAQAAQEAYDNWEQDEEGMDVELGGGGICQDIAEKISDVLNSHGIEATTVDNQGMGEQHVWAVAKVKEGVYAIDIDYHRYETGGGYTWKKRLGVKFDSNDVDIYPMDVEWENIINGY